MNKWFEVIEKLANIHNELQFILPIHPNPNVQKHRHILNRVIVIDPVNHNEMINLLRKCKFIISDSGGIQEEASYLNKKIIICRKYTERPEVLESHGILCDSPDKLENIFNDININYMVNKECPFGNGESYKNIINILEKL